MRPSNRLTPYPVLTPYQNDYIDASFTAEVEAVQQFGDVRVNVAFKLDEPVLADLINRGLAEYAIHIECPSTSHRECVGTADGLYSITLDRQKVRDLIEVCTFIVAKAQISSLTSPRFHPDYSDLTFDIDEGGVLAIGDCKQVAIKNDEDIAQRSSILNVTKAGSGQRDSMAVNTDLSDNVLISLRPDLYEVYAQLGGGPDSEVILSLVILPALQTVLTRMAESGEDGTDSDKDWFKSLLEILTRNDISLSDIDNYSDDMSALSIAQRILSQPLDRSLKSLVKEV